MKYKKTIILITAILIQNKLFSEQIMTFFLRPFPAKNKETETIKRIDKIGRVGKMPKYALRSLTKNQFTSGIFCTYDGYLAISDLHGQVTFLRKHKDKKIHILITENIVPIIMLENTVHHWEIAKPDKTKMYEIEKKLDIPAKTYFWEIKQIDIPKDNIISTDTIVIIANPKKVYIPEGITITTQNPQLVLPDIYVKRGIEKLTNTLYMFGIKNLFATTDTVYNKGTAQYSHQIKE